MSILDFGLADDDGLGDPLRDTFRKINVMLSRIVASRTTDVAAITPAVGDLYIVPASATTGVFVGNEGKLAYYTGSAWEFYTAPDGFRVKVDDDDNEVEADGADAWTVVSGGNSYYDIQSGFTTTPTSSQILDTIYVGRAVTFPANFSGSGGQIGTNPTASFAIDVQDDGVSIGTITIGTGGSFTFATASGTEKVVAAGSILTFVAPGSVDATAANGIWTILGTAA